MFSVDCISLKAQLSNIVKVFQWHADQSQSVDVQESTLIGELEEDHGRGLALVMDRVQITNS